MSRDNNIILSPYSNTNDTIYVVCNDNYRYALCDYLSNLKFVPNEAHCLLCALFRILMIEFCMHLFLWMS